MYREAREINDPAWDCTMIKTMKAKGETTVNPIYHWLDKDIWDYITQNNIKVNPLYSCGYSRVGCIGCPLATYHKRMREFSDYPKYKQLYINAFEKMLDVRRDKGLDAKMDWKNGDDVFNWWVEEYKYNVKGQMSLSDFMEDNE